MFCGPRGRGYVCDALNRCVCKAWQDVGEVVAHWDFEAAAAFDYREDRGYTRPGLFTSDVDPVFSPKATPRMEFSARLLLSSSSG